MQSVSSDTFGPLVSYLVPGATVLAALHPHLPAVGRWLAVRPDETPTLGGFLFLTLAALAVGMTVSAVRWAAVEPLLRLTGVPDPPRDFARLAETLDAVRYLHDIHYRHYLFFANMAVAVAVASASYHVWRGGLAVGWPDAAVAVLEIVLLAAARDTLAKLRTRSAQVLAPRNAARDGRRPRVRRGRLMPES